MKKLALDKAKEHLELAVQSLEQMSLEHGFKTYEQGWSQFLTQASRIYSKLEQGAKGCGTSEPWFGRKKHERKSDQLLSYIHHARNCDEHAIEHITSLTADSVFAQIDPTRGGSMRFQFMVDDSGTMHFRDIAASDGAGESVPVEFIQPKVVLLPVTDRRYNVRFDPPQSHRGKEIEDDSPRAIAELAVSYLEELIADASLLPHHR